MRKHMRLVSCSFNSEERERERICFEDANVNKELQGQLRGVEGQFGNMTSVVGRKCPQRFEELTGECFRGVLRSRYLSTASPSPQQVFDSAIDTWNLFNIFKLLIRSLFILF